MVARGMSGNLMCKLEVTRSERQFLAFSESGLDFSIPSTAQSSTRTKSGLDFSISSTAQSSPRTKSGLDFSIPSTAQSSPRTKSGF